MNLVELSQRIKQRRLDLGLSLEETAAAAGQTRSWLSKVENFRITPSLPALARVAEALRIPLSKLLEGLDARPQIVLTRRKDRRVIERDPQNSNIVYHSLIRGRANRQMNPFVLEVPAGGGRDISRPHEGEEFLIVLDGKVTLEYGKDSYQLTDGDALYFEADTPHRLHNPHKKPAQVLCVFLEK
ncbi:HTH-type transcriptional regulator PuuR [Caulifigura coniformis]|uniref:HTH-type transcriptional regulator PuuR n=1 Tax=Caulifigura coniformis TaxID=2527983 RepID=A0A517SLI9_9PLAN|nr:cupin domain-containing protein [Caulifigura coniformis]QDT56987.1 HTH-type transcriptional regulator PuuR [Caulifigura coniformis]